MTDRSGRVRPGRPAAATATDADLATRAATGDRRAYGELLRRHDPALRRVAFRILGDPDAMDDALQEAYVKAWRALPDFRGEVAVAGWLYRIVYHACLDELRVRRRPTVAAGPLAPDGSDGPPSAARGPEQAATDAVAVRTALAALPLEQRATVVLVDGEGLDHRQAADVLGVAPGTVASRLSRARATLRQAIEEVS